MQNSFEKGSENTFGLIPETLKYWVGVQRSQSYLMGRSCLLALVDRTSSDAVMIKMPHEVDISHQPAVHPIFSYWVG